MRKTDRDLAVGRVATVGLELSLGPPVGAVGPGRGLGSQQADSQTEKCPQSHLK